jgi:16S rRNA U516 pseudouridylate synthase RsuA-like enzyme
LKPLKAGRPSDGAQERKVLKDNGRRTRRKLLAAAGLGSRRACETFIEAGRVMVNGKVIHLGDKADPARDSISLDGKLLHLKQEKILHRIE